MYDTYDAFSLFLITFEYKHEILMKMHRERFIVRSQDVTDTCTSKLFLLRQASMKFPVHMQIRNIVPFIKLIGYKSILDASNRKQHGIIR